MKRILISYRRARPLLNNYMKNVLVPSHERAVARNEAGRSVRKQKHWSVVGWEHMLDPRCRETLDSISEAHAVQAISFSCAQGDSSWACLTTALSMRAKPGEVQSPAKNIITRSTRQRAVGRHKTVHGIPNICIKIRVPLEKQKECECSLGCLWVIASLTQFGTSWAIYWGSVLSFQWWVHGCLISYCLYVWTILSLETT